MYILVSSTLPISCRLTVIRRVFLVVRDIFTLPTHLSLPPIFCGAWVPQSLIFCVVFCRTLYVLLSLFFQQLHCMSFDSRVLSSSEIVWIVDIIVWVRGAHMSNLCYLFCLCSVCVLWTKSHGSLHCPFRIVPFNLQNQTLKRWRFIQFNVVSHE